jgi:glycosyltransferase involved in cell wall biosynthesis
MNRHATLHNDLAAQPTYAPRPPVLVMARLLGPGGTERQLAETAKWLHKRGFPVHAASFFGNGIRADELRSQAIPILELPVRSLTNRTALDGARQFGRYLREHRIRIVHAFDFSSDIFAAPVARWFRTPVILTSQRCYLDLVPAKYHRLLRFSHWVADGVVANCDAMKQHLMADLGVPERKIHVCYNGIDTALFHPGGRRRMEPLAEASLVIGTVSVLREEKRLDLLLKAFAKVSREHPGLQLVLAGGGAERENLERLAAALGIRDACWFEPEVADAASWLRSIDVFVLPSRSEALSNSLMEAMACGCCPVASRVGGNPELVTHGETGLLFASGDEADLARQLELAIADHALRERLGAAAARKIVTGFSLEMAGLAMEEVYVGALGRVGERIAY